MNRTSTSRFIRVAPLLMSGVVALAQTPPAAPAAAPTPSAQAPAAGAPDTMMINMGRGQANYPIPYTPASVKEIKAVLDRIRVYLESATPSQLVDRTTNQPIADFSKPNANATTPRGDFQLVSYEWGVTYAGMLLAAETTGDKSFADYTAKRFKLISDIAPMFRAQAQASAGAMPTPSAQQPGGQMGGGPGEPPGPGMEGPGGVPGAGGPGGPDAPGGQGGPGGQVAAAGQGGPGGQGGRGGFGGRMMSPVRSVVSPMSLDDSGSMCAAMIKAQRAGVVGADLRPLIDTYIEWIFTKQYRFEDGTLARKRPLLNSLWLDDLFMSVPALAQMGKLTGEQKYYDDAVKQVLQFSERMFVKEKGLYMHGWIQSMDVHPAFHWGRANGWAVMTMAELLDVLPENHPGRAKVLEYYRAHVRGLAACQGSDGLWHQLLDRPDSYPETSASAIFVYAIARGINRGWLDPIAHGPMVCLGWNAVAKKVNDKGQVEGTCVGTGMGFEPMFYCYRPTSVYAAHGYGPVLLAGAEMIAFRNGKGKDALVSDGAIQMQRSASFF